METAAIDWPVIDTVLLDMDGTLLDLRFDNWFWQDHIPQRYAAVRGMDPGEARALLEPRFRARRGTLQWYCIEHWSRELGLDIALMKRGFDARRQVGYLPGAEDFLVRLRAMGKRVILVTNSHPTVFAIKDEQTGLSRHFDACHSTHGFDAPKEHPDFWPRFQAAEPFTAERTLFVDDSLPVLDAARSFGIGWLRAVRCPDTGLPAQSTGAYRAIDRVADLLPRLPA